MLANYLKTALRFLGRNKSFSLINILGLCVGTICCLYILVYVRDQYTYDRHHVASNQIYRVATKLKKNSNSETSMRSSVVAPIGPLIKKDFPEVADFTRVVPMLGIDKHLLRFEDKAIFEKNAVYVDPSFFNIFNFHFVAGNRLSSLKEPGSVVLLKPVATKLFGDLDPVGKSITLENVGGKSTYTVGGVIDESFGKSHLEANIFITMNSGGTGDYVLKTDNWTRNGYIDTYIKLSSGEDPAALEKRFPAFVEQYGGKQLKNAGIEQQLFLQPVIGIHTNTDTEGFQYSRPVSKTFLGFLTAIAIVIQLIACINFMNLSTARATNRAKEVGVRKVIGAGRGQLISQFLGESFLMCVISVLCAVPLLIILLPYLNQVTGTDLDAMLFLDKGVLLILLATVLTTGLLAGSYPAFYLSAFQAIKVFKGNSASPGSAIGIRKSLVVFQFVLSITLIIGISIMQSQIRFMQNKELGFEKDQRLVINFNTDAGNKRISGFMNDLRNIAGIREVSNASKYLGSPLFFSNGFFLKGETDADARVTDFVISDQHFTKVNGIKLISGRDFLPTDSAKVLINETMMKRLNLNPQSAPGTLLYDNQERVEEIVGVMQDFNFGSLHKEVGNFLVWMRQPRDENWSTVIASTNTTDYKTLLSKIEFAWRQHVPHEPFSFTFMDQQIMQLYEAELNLARIINLFTAVAVFVSCLGLFGLAAFSAQQREREIGIRKVLGAGMFNLSRLLIGDFVKLVMIAFLIASPLAWLIGNRWLEGFAYKVDIGWQVFLLAAIGVLGIAVITVGFQAIQAAGKNPVKSIGA